jgi:hypothetical protein
MDAQCADAAAGVPADGERRRGRPPRGSSRGPRLGERARGLLRRPLGVDTFEAGGNSKPSGGLEPPTPSLPSGVCRGCPRVPARTRSDAPVSYPRVVVSSLNRGHASADEAVRMGITAGRAAVGEGARQRAPSPSPQPVSPRRSRCSSPGCCSPGPASPLARANVVAVVDPTGRTAAARREQGGERRHSSSHG